MRIHFWGCQKPTRVDDYPIYSEKLNEIDNAECRSVLILFAPHQPENGALNLKHQKSHIKHRSRR